MTDSHDKSALLSPVTTQRASEAIYNQLRGLILSGRLKPGDSLPSERSMMDSFKRSRPTIREALRMLERAGLVKSSPGRGGAVVMKPGAGSFLQPFEDMISVRNITGTELLELRELIEIAAAEWAAERHNSNDDEYLNRALDEALGAVGTDDFFEADMRFHKSLAKAAHNKLAEAIHEVLHQLVIETLVESFYRQSPERQIFMQQEIVSDHSAVLTAILASDVELAGAKMRYHVHGFETLMNG